MKSKILITGSSGFIGKIITPVLSDKNNIFLTQRDEKDKKLFLDLTKLESIEKKLDEISPDFIIHLAAITHIDICEEDKVNKKNGLVWKTNVLSTEKIVNYCDKTNCHLIYLSTEAVFNGITGNYKESDKKDPINWYGVTKAAAEDLVLTLKNKTILRAVISYYEHSSESSIYGKILKELKRKGSIGAVFDQEITPTYVPDIGKALIRIISLKKNGIFHLVPNKKITPYQFAKWVTKKEGFNINLVKPVSLEQFFGFKKSKLRLKKATLSNEKTKKILDIEFRELDNIL